MQPLNVLWQHLITGLVISTFIKLIFILILKNIKTSYLENLKTIWRNPETTFVTTENKQSTPLKIPKKIIKNVLSRKLNRFEH